MNLTQAWVTKNAGIIDEDFQTLGGEASSIPTQVELNELVAAEVRRDLLRETGRRGYFTLEGSSKSVVERAASFVKFLSSAQGFRPMYAQVHFRRTSGGHELSDNLALQAWLAHVAGKARSGRSSTFSIENFTKDAIATLTKFSLNENGPVLALDFLDSMGIKVVVEYQLPGMSLDGASFYIPKVGPTIALTLRYDRIDNFWFTLMHELAHVVLHLTEDNSAVFVDSLDDESLYSTLETEAEANAFAGDAFIPRDIWTRSEAFRTGKEQAIRALAMQCNIHPAIVAGRYRFEKKRFTELQSLIGQGGVRDILLRRD